MPHHAVYPVACIGHTGSVYAENITGAFATTEHLDYATAELLGLHIGDGFVNRRLAIQMFGADEVSRVEDEIAAEILEQHRAGYASYLAAE